MPAAEDLPIPGSLVLIDINNELARLHAGGSEGSDIVLSPTPSDDVNDPLRWSNRRKQLGHAMLVVYVVTVGISCTSLYSCLLTISAGTTVPLATLNAGTGYMFLLLGWGGLITQPLALTYGKRPVYLASMIGVLGTVIWMNFINNESEWLANKVVQGLFASPIEMLIEISIADMFYAHERGFYIGIYGMTLFGSNFFAPAWAGWVNGALGYKWVFWVTAIQQVVGIIVIFFFLEETNYNRGTTEMAETTHQTTSASLDDEKAVAKNSPQISVQAVGMEGVEYSFAQKLRLFSVPRGSTSNLIKMVYRPLLFLRFPVVVWAGLLYGSALVWYNVLNATAAVIFTSPGYEFSEGLIGMTYVGPMIGAIAAWPWSGWIADRFILWYARRRGGMREPEDRLWLLALNAVLCPVGLILWGVGAAKGINWFGLVFGGSLVAFTSATGGAFAINYAIDSYKDLSGEIMITVMLIRNSLSFAIGYGITPWLTMGYQNTFITAAMVGLLFYASFYVVIKFGKSWRASSRVAYWGYVETSVISH